MSLSAAVNADLERFREQRELARKFHAEFIGDVDPERCFADFLVSVAQAGNDSWAIRRKGINRLESVYKAALSEFDGGTVGGYLVPTELRADLFRDVAEESVFRASALVVPMKSATLELPLPDAISTATAGTSPFFGGMLLQWIAQDDALPETEPKFQQVVLTAWQLGGYLLMSNPLMEDGLAIESHLRRLLARAIAFYEDLAFFQGSGAGQPLGVINGGGVQKITRSGSGAFVAADAANVIAGLIPGSWATSIWACNPTVLAKIAQLTGWMQNVPQHIGKRNNIQGSFDSRPLYVTEKLPRLGTLGDIMLFDPSLYVIGDRQQLEIAASAHFKFTSNKMTWRVLERVDGQPWLSKTVTLEDGTTTAGAYVGINA